MLRPRPARPRRPGCRSPSLLLAAGVATLLLTAGCTGDPEVSATTPAGRPSTPTSAPSTVADPALLEAARRGDAPAAGRVLRDGAVDATSAGGRTALRTAVEDGDGGPGYVDTARLLVARGAAVPPGLVERARSHAQDAVVATLTAAQAGPPTDPAAVLLAAATSGDADAAAPGPVSRSATPVSARRCCWP